MEPILELATEITTQLWLLHGLNPKGVTLEAALNKCNDKFELGAVREEGWRARLMKQAFGDYARLQAIVDIAGQEKNWDLEDPLKKLSFHDEAEITWRRPIESYRVDPPLRFLGRISGTSGSLEL